MYLNVFQCFIIPQCPLVQKNSSQEKTLLNKSKTNMKLHHSNVGQCVCAVQHLV